MNVFLCICAVWTVLSFPAALLLGAVIASAEKPAAELSEPEIDPRWDVAA